VDSKQTCRFVYECMFWFCAWAKVLKGKREKKKRSNTSRNHLTSSSTQHLRDQERRRSEEGSPIGVGCERVQRDKWKGREESIM